MTASFEAHRAEASTSGVREFANRVRTLVEAELDRLVPAEVTEPTTVHAAIRWSLFAPGKRFRPTLLFATGETLGATVDELLRTACAFEMVHTYSLVHDDLPCIRGHDQNSRAR